MHFGVNEVQPGQPLDNAERIREEMGDLLGVYKMLVDEGILLWPEPEKVHAKKTKVEKFIRLSQDLGQVEPTIQPGESDRVPFKNREESPLGQLLQRMDVQVRHLEPHQKSREQGKLLIDALAELKKIIAAADSMASAWDQPADDNGELPGMDAAVDSYRELVSLDFPHH